MRSYPSSTAFSPPAPVEFDSNHLFSASPVILNQSNPMQHSLMRFFSEFDHIVTQELSGLASRRHPPSCP
ncbi:MAG: hypothetical protein U0003_00300 [Vampirovibrionales bacterium]